MPPVEASYLVACLVLMTSFLTAKQFKAYKGWNHTINLCGVKYEGMKENI